MKRNSALLSITFALLPIAACTPNVVPVSVEPSDFRTVQVQNVALILERDALVRAVTQYGGETSIGAKWPIDVREGLESSLRSAFPAETATSAAAITIRVDDLSVNVEHGPNVPGQAMLNAKSELHLSYDLRRRDGTIIKSGVAIGRGTTVDRGVGWKLDQRLGSTFASSVHDAVTVAVADVARAVAYEMAR